MKQVIKRLDNVDTQVKNIINIYNQSTIEEKQAGNNWYNEANNLCQLMSVKYNLTLCQTVGILASLSPATNWNQNVIDANNLCSLLSVGKNINTIVCTTYNQNKLKAFYIWQNKQLSESDIYKILLGASKTINKTSSFYSNILNPDESKFVTIDRHSFRVNLGLTETPDIILTEKRYKVMQSAYIKAATKIKISAIQLQAITWLTFRRLNNIIRDKQFNVIPFNN